jgi:aminocarboxymuconate-semialdehyde decarboxylase
LIPTESHSCCYLSFLSDSTFVIVDLHSHFFPPEAATSDGPVQLRTRGDGALELDVRGHSFVLPAALCDIVAQRKDAIAAGIDVRVLQPPPFTVLYELPADEGNRWCRVLNERIAEHAAASEGSLLGFATVPLQAGGEAAAQELRRAKDLGLVGVQVLTSVCGAPLDAPELEPFFAAATELGMITSVHPHFVSGADRMRTHHLRNLIGNPVETTLTAARLWTSGLLERYPGLRIILAHGGGAFPQLALGRLQHGYDRRAEFADVSMDPVTAARRFHYDSVVFSPVVLNQLVELVGADRIVVGTDFPFDMAVMRPLDLVGDPRVADGTLLDIVARTGEALLASELSASARATQDQENFS